MAWCVENCFWTFKLPFFFDQKVYVFLKKSPITTTMSTKTPAVTSTTAEQQLSLKKRLDLAEVEISHLKKTVSDQAKEIHDKDDEMGELKSKLLAMSTEPSTSSTAAAERHEEKDCFNISRIMGCYFKSTLPTVIFIVVLTHYSFSPFPWMELLKILLPSTPSQWVLTFPGSGSEELQKKKPRPQRWCWLHVSCSPSSSLSPWLHVWFRYCRKWIFFEFCKILYSFLALFLFFFFLVSF